MDSGSSHRRVRHLARAGLVVAAAGAALLLTGTAASAVSTRSLVPERVFQYDPLPAGDRAIQAFDHGRGHDILYTQRIGTNTQLSRCQETSAKTCTQLDTVSLPGYGHGESLDVYTSGTHTYAWIGSNHGSVSPYWSRDASLIEYLPAASGSTKASYRVLGTVTGLAAVAPGHSGEGYRNAVAIADGSDRIAFRSQLDSSAANTYYGVYKLAALTKALTADSDRRMSIAQLSGYRVSHFKLSTRPNNSFQGFDIKGVGSGQKFLYLFGGAAGQHPTIYKYLYTNGGTLTHVKTYQINGGYVGSLEAEGVKVEADPDNGGKERVFIGLNPTRTDTNGRKQYRLYRFTE